MHKSKHLRRTTRLLWLLLSISAACSAIVSGRPAPGARAASRGAMGQPSVPAAVQQSAPAADPQYRVNLPLTIYTWVSPFGTQSDKRLTSGNLLGRASELKTGWARVGPISWRALQPDEGGPIRWSVLGSIEQELRALNKAGIMAEAVIIDSPRWATINKPFVTSCGAIRADKVGAFAAFMQALVARYGTPEFNLRNWELGNEVDVDPRLVRLDNGFGCWGNIDDPFYGGRQYGEMLKVVAPAIKAVDPAARVWIGGLLLSSPNTTDPRFGKPERFLAGVLEAGAAPYFDVVPYHWYPSYGDKKLDYDYGIGGEWDRLGGGIVGKARYLRQIMQGYGVSKPLFINEISFICPNDIWGSYPWCINLNPEFYDLQSALLVRMYARGMADGLTGFIWYTLEGPGWSYGSLLNADETPKPVYNAYKWLNARIEGAAYKAPAAYGSGIEGYSFVRGETQIDIVWAKRNETLVVSLPQASFEDAFTMYGQRIIPNAAATTYQLLVPFEPIYIVRRP